MIVHQELRLATLLDLGLPAPPFERHDVPIHLIQVAGILEVQRVLQVSMAVRELLAKPPYTRCKVNGDC